MNNTIGHTLTLTLLGESHGEEIGAVLDGISPGVEVSEKEIAVALARRRPKNSLSTGRREPDRFRIVSGVKGGRTTGAPLTLLIPNQAQHSEDYESESFLPRPSHADYTAYKKYHGYEDRRGGGHFSGRLTAPLVAVGAILTQALLKGGVTVGSHIASLYTVSDHPLSETPECLLSLRKKEFPVLDDEAGERMQACIRRASEEGDSLGGVIETCALGLPVGLGEPWFDTVEGELSKLLFSIPAVKGVSFGDGFSLTALRGSEANDPFAVRDGRLVTLTNHNGGINGGITNGMPLRFSTAIKPTPSIFKEQRSADPVTLREFSLQIRGRHDPAIVHRAVPVVDAVTAILLSDLLLRRYGTDALTDGKFAKLAREEGAL